MLRCLCAALLFVSTQSIAQVLCWQHPTARANGQALTREEIGGYEIRYKRLVETQYVRKKVAARPAYWSTKELTGEYMFEIATVDTNGLYSEFVAITPRKNCLSAPGDIKLGAPTDLQLGD